MVWVWTSTEIKGRTPLYSTWTFLGETVIGLIIGVNSYVVDSIVFELYHKKYFRKNRDDFNFLIMFKFGDQMYVGAGLGFSTRFLI